MEVMVRRDRDGFPIVKTQFKPTYKYDLEYLLSLDNKEEKIRMKETLNALYKQMMPSTEDGNKGSMEELSKVMLQMQNVNNEQ